MSESAEGISPTGLLSPTDEGERDASGNGFTAVNVNGHSNSSPGGSKIVRIDEGDRSRTSQDDRGHRARDSTEMHTNGNGSPLTGAVKRKRSTSELNDEESDESGSDDGSPETVGDPLHGSRPYPGPPPPPPSGDGRERAWNNGHGRSMEGDPEARLAEALQRDNQSANGHNGAMDDERGNMSGRPNYYQNEHNGIITTNAGVQMDPKKRKRAFTNRTKTGCQTCRRRKKKCDEAKPECNNCQRGGFVCEGYAAKSPWPKPNVSKQLPTPIQSRVIYGESQGNLYPRQPRNDHYMDSPSQMHSGMRGRPVTMEDDLPDRPVNGWSGYGGSHRPYNDRDSHGIPIPAHSLQMRDGYDRPMSASTHHSGMNPMHGHGLHPAQSPLTQGHQGLAQRALNQLPPHEGRMSQPMGFHGQSEREKMVSGELYLPYSRELQDERERMKDALHSYNYMRKPGTNSEERSRDLRMILDPIAGASSTRIGKGVYVEPPFQCDYGYNITIGKDVAIEAGCFISDAREVSIGDETVIGPNVKIIAKVYPYELEIRKGGPMNGKARGIKIIIGKWVHIGAGCTIAPDEELCPNGILEIGEGSYITPGSTVVKSIPPRKKFGQKYPELMDVISDLPTPKSMDKDRHF